jgi:RND family efflux transporter MFP subunit
MKHKSLVLIIFTAAAVGCGSSPEPGKQASRPPTKVTVAFADRTLESSKEEFMGTVIARNRAGIESKVQARVERIPIALGSRVSKGDLLAELDLREFRARVDQAKAVYEQASQDLLRFETLLKQQAATQQEYDGVRARKSVAEATLSEAETFLSYAGIRAPFSGTVTQKMVDEGDLALPGRPLFILEEEGVMRLEAMLPESRLGQVVVGDSVLVTIPATNTTLWGRVEEVSPSADPVSRSFGVKVHLPTASGVRPGQFGRLQLAAHGDETIFIPRTALVRRGQLDLVYVVSSEKKAMLRLVRIGREFPDRLEILAGLKENERVVTSGHVDLSDGDLVEEQP